MQQEPERYKPTEAQLKARRKRNIALALALLAFVIIVYLGSMIKIGPALLNRAL